MTRFRLNGSKSKILKRERNVWQRRFWEHQIRNDEDLIRHADYIHYNPVKHSLVGSPHAWKHSSLHRCVRDGLYHPDWGVNEPVTFDGAIGNE